MKIRAVFECFGGVTWPALSSCRQIDALKVLFLRIARILETFDKMPTGEASF